MFADNRTISWLQMKRQIFLTFLGPVFLWLSKKNEGVPGIVIILIGTGLYHLWLFFLLRQLAVYRTPRHYFGKTLSWGIGIVYQIYLILTGGMLLFILTDLTECYLVQGISSFVWMFLFLLLALESNKSLEGRGRFAQVTWPMLLGGVVLLFVMFLLQGKLEITENLWIRDSQVALITEQMGLFLVMFSGIVLMPFLLPQVTTETGKRREVFRATGRISLLMMAGTCLQGRKLHRMDILLVSIVLFSLWYALSSVLFYSAWIGEKMMISMGKIPVAIGSFLIGVALQKGLFSEKQYEIMVLTVFVPLFVAILFCTEVARRKCYEKNVE